MNNVLSSSIVVRFVVVALLALALNLGFHHFEQHETEILESSAAVLKTAGYQAVLAYRIGSLSQALVHGSSKTDRDLAREGLAEQVERLEASRRALKLSPGGGGQERPERETEGGEPLARLEEEIHKLTAAAAALMEEEAPSPRSSGFQEIDETLSSETLPGAIEGTLDEHHKKSESAVAGLRDLRHWVRISSAFLLVTLGLVVFAPLIRQVRRNIDKLHLLKLTLEQRMADQKQAQQEMTRQAQELARSNCELEQFASVASHDLQEPLRKIAAFGDRLEATCGDHLSEEGKDYLRRMQNAAKRMQALINGLLTLSRVTSRAQPFREVDLGEVVSEVLADLEVRIDQAAARVRVSDLPTVEADPMQMRQLMQNLIGNALKFCHPERPPIVKVYSRAAEAGGPEGNGASQGLREIVVEDNGVGFDPKYADRLFKVFERLHSRQQYEGTGVGLAICRKIAERHGGSIEAKSEPMQGAKFIVTLPLRQAAGEQTYEADHHLVRG